MALYNTYTTFSAPPAFSGFWCKTNEQEWDDMGCVENSSSIELCCLFFRLVSIYLSIYLSVLTLTFLLFFSFEGLFLSHLLSFQDE
jgi:hypothetical protein